MLSYIGQSKAQISPEGRRFFDQVISSQLQGLAAGQPLVIAHMVGLVLTGRELGARDAKMLGQAFGCELDGFTFVLKICQQLSADVFQGTAEGIGGGFKCSTCRFQIMFTYKPDFGWNLPFPNWCKTPGTITNRITDNSDSVYLTSVCCAACRSASGAVLWSHWSVALLSSAQRGRGPLLRLLRSQLYWASHSRSWADCTAASPVGSTQQRLSAEHNDQCWRWDWFRK